MSAVLQDNILPPLSPVVAAVKGPGQTVIDAATGTITYEHKGASLLLAEAVAIHAEACDLAPLIDCPAMYSEAGDLLKRITDSYKTLDEQRLASTKPLRDKVDEINADYKPAIEKRKEAAEVIKRGMIAFDQKVEAERREAERIARQRAEEERRRAEAEAAAARKRAEEEAAAARQAAEERAAEERRIANENAERMLAEAKQLDEAGNFARAAQLRTEANAILGIAEEAAQTALFEGEQAAATAANLGDMEAESLQAAAQMITPPVLAVASPKAAGVSKSTKYWAEVKDPKRFVQYVLENWETMQHLLTIEQGKLNTFAQNQKDRFSVPGCELHSGTQMAARRR